MPESEPAVPARPLIQRLSGHSSVRYLVVGGTAFCIDFGLLALLKIVFGWPVWLASGTSFLVSFFFTYTMQRFFSFGSSAPHGPSLVKYAILVGFNTLATMAITSGIDISVLGWGTGKIIATIATTIWNYFAYRYWVFAPDRGIFGRRLARTGQPGDSP